MKKTCKHCKAVTGAWWNPSTGCYRIIREAGCGLGYRTDGAMHPEEECPKPLTRQAFKEMEAKK